MKIEWIERNSLYVVEDATKVILIGQILIIKDSHGGYYHIYAPDVESFKII